MRVSKRDVPIHYIRWLPKEFFVGFGGAQGCHVALGSVRPRYIARISQRSEAV